jgi:hypothetical protein
MKSLFTFVLCLLVLTCAAQKVIKNDFIIGEGQMPNLTKDARNNIHLVFGMGDSIMYSSLTYNSNEFSNPTLVAVLPKVYTFATRGPQIAATKNGLVITAVTSTGNIHSYYKLSIDNFWIEGKNVNDVIDVAKEGLSALSADGNNVIAVWLDLRNTKQNKIYSSRSTDGGKTWLENKLVYKSPDSTVCECCKPNVIIKDNIVYVMFRNWLNGNRDLYMSQSNDGGKAFGKPVKLGTGSWKLNGCPMDGGSMALNNKGEVQTVWRREGSIYSAFPWNTENKIGEGRNCTVETLNSQNFYAWSENGDIVIVDDGGQKVKTGKGMLPVLKTHNNNILCVWENEKQIHASLVNFEQ